MKWRYFVEIIANAQLTKALVEAKLDLAGQKGWELVSIITVGTNTVFVLKKLISR